MKNLFFFLFLLFPFLLQAQRIPSLDMSFNDNGSFFTDFSILDISVQPDEKILAIGTISGESKLIRLNPDNGLDESFGKGGEINMQEIGWKTYKACSSCTPGADTKIFVQPDGKIIIGSSFNAETIYENIETVIVLLRLNVDGSVDSEFGNSGIIYLNNSTPNFEWWGARNGRNFFRDLLFHQDKILVGGISEASSPIDEFESIFAASLFQLNMDGTLDKTFGDDGKKLIFKKSLYEGVTEDYDNISIVGMEFQSDGKIIIFGTGRHPVAEGGHLALIRIFPDGTIDESFNNGEHTIRGEGPYENLLDLLILENDEIILSAVHHEEWDINLNHLKMQLIKLNKDGGLNKIYDPSELELGPGDLISVSDGFLLMFSRSIIKYSDSGFPRHFISSFSYYPFLSYLLQKENKLLVVKFNQQTNVGSITRYIIGPTSDINILKFTLINAQTNEEIFELEDGQVINLQEIGTNEINIRAYTDPEPTGSVSFRLSGQESYQFIDNDSFYALYSNEGEDFFSWIPSLGSYNLNATAFSASDAQGEFSNSLTISFSIVDEQIEPEYPAPIITPLQSFAIDGGVCNVLGAIEAINADPNTILGNWKVLGGSGAAIFSLDENSGEIKIAKASLIDFKKSSYTLNVTVSNGNMISDAEEVTISIPKKVTVCHKNKRNISVSKNAAPAQLKNGGCLGACTNLMAAVKEPELLINNSFSIYPNPVKEQLNISLGANEWNFQYIELYDLSGKRIVQIPVNGESEVVIPRNSMQPHLYLLRLVGDQVINKKIILE